MATTSSTDKLTSLLIENQFPDFAKDEGPDLIAFIKAYYEWMELSGKVTERSKSLLEYADIDTTLDQFVQYFEGEVMDSIPKTIAADKRLLAKHIRDLYVAKGSQEAFRLLFRMLYDEEIDFYYPGIDMLRASDGRWTEETSVRLSDPSLGSVVDLAGSIITGLTSGAVAKVERVEGSVELGIPVKELFLSGLSGTYLDGETVRNAGNTINGTVFSVTGPMTTVEITQGGNGHEVGDVLRFTGTTSGTGANGVVATTDNLSAVEFTLLAGGSGYRIADTGVTITSGVGSGAAFTVDAISNTANITFATTTISAIAQVPIGEGPTFSSQGSNTMTLEANIAMSNAYSTLQSSLNFDTVLTGTISSITSTFGGQGYSVLPTIIVRDQDIFDLERTDPNGGIKGGNAKIAASYLGGAILSINVNAIGSAYDKYAEVIIANLTDGSAVNGAGIPSVTGLVKHPGKYTDTKGYLSWNNKLQDNYYYQEYSYVVRSKQFISKYRDVVKRLIHPAGTALFGRFQIDVETVQTGAGDPTTILNRKWVTDMNINIPVVVSGEEADYIIAGPIGAIDKAVYFANTDYETLVANTNTPTVEHILPYKAIIERPVTITPDVDASSMEVRIGVAAIIQTTVPSTVERGLPTIVPVSTDYIDLTSVLEQSIVVANTVQAQIEVVGTRVQILKGRTTGPDFAANRRKQGHKIITIGENSLLSAFDIHRFTDDVKTRIVTGPSTSYEPVTEETEFKIIIPSTAANTSNLRLVSGGQEWIRATGNVEIIVSGVIDDYDHLLISVYQAVAINALGTDQAVARDDEDSTTQFTVEISNNDFIYIYNQANTATANIFFTVDKVYSDALLTITNSYPVAALPLTNAAMFVANSFVTITSTTQGDG
jgi:hypothetical protein